MSQKFPQLDLTIKLVKNPSADYQQVIAIRKKVFVEEQGVPQELEIDDHEKTSSFFLCFIDDQGVGTGRIRVWKDFTKFERIAVLKEWRGKSIGHKLMLEMQDYADEYFPTKLPLMTAQLSALSFYQKLGWVEVGNHFIEAGIDHVMMIHPPKENDRIKKMSQQLNRCGFKEVEEYFLSALN